MSKKPDGVPPKILNLIPRGEFTPVETRMLNVLKDGLPHFREELRACLYDAEQGSFSTVRCHIGRIRRRLRPQGQDIICELYKRNISYRQIRLLNGPPTLHG